MEVYHNRPNFADADAQEDARQRLTHVRIVPCTSCLSRCVLGSVAFPCNIMVSSHKA